ncbi:NRDE-3 protein, partial [Aphelenchoides avenae]
MLGLDDSFFGSGNDRNVQYCYDCGINMYGIRPLMERGEERRFSINVDKIPTDCRTLISRNVDNIEARLLAVETIDLFDKTAVAAISQGDRSVVQFLEVLSSQQMISDGDHHIFPQKMFEKRSRHQLQRDPRILKDGMQKNVRYVGDSVEEAQPIIQIDPKKAAFFPAVSLGRFLEEIIPGGGSLETKLLDDRNYRTAAKQVKNLVVRTNHLDSNRFFAVNGLTKDGSDRVKFEFEGRKISVAAYFSERYNIRLRFSKLPCVVEVRKVRVEGQTQKVENYYPIEVLDIEDGQRVPLQKQSGALTEQMIRQCQALPKSFRDLNEQQRDKASITSGNPYFKAHGVRPESQMLRAQAEVLFPPALVYGRDREEPQGANLMWRMGPQRQFLIAADAPAVWAAVIFQRGVEGNRCKDFLQRLVQSANNRGFPLSPPKRYDQWDDTDPEFIRGKLAFYAENRCSYIVFFTKDKMDPVHHTMKFFETEFPIVTQHISGATMEKGIGNKGAFLVLDNILMKMHLKLGGVNHGLSTARDMQRCNNLGHDIVAKEWLAPTRMFIGLDLSHAGPQSLYERQSGQPVNDPTVVG